jgi:20S proteasome alpha/beta subunit
MRRSSLFLESLTLLLLLLISQVTTASNSNSNYNVYNYDMTTPQFTPDGRLLQVEYASVAAELSTPLVVVQVNNDTLILVTLKSSTTYQSRMVLFDDVCIAMSGVLADSIALLQVVLEQASQHLRRYHQKSLTVLQVATAMANACQKHAFGGGVRPYGSTMLACGYTVGQKQPILYQTDPSGAIRQVDTSSTSTSTTIQCIVGGNPTFQRQLRKRMDSNLARRKDSSIADTVAIVARTLIKETQKASPHKGGKNEAPSSSLEVVLLSPTLGCHRLTKNQLDTIMERAAA